MAELVIVWFVIDCINKYGNIWDCIDCCVNISMDCHRLLYQKYGNVLACCNIGSIVA